MFDENDMILPEGFDPNATDQNLAEFGVEPEAELPTTETTANETDTGVVEESPVESSYPTTGTVEAEVPSAPTVKVQYNHEDRELSLDEAAVLAQKGLNYDKIASRSREQETRLSRYEELARMFGFENAEAMMTSAEQNFVESRVRDLMEQGNSEAISRFLVTQEMQKQRAASAPVAAPTAVDAPLPPGMTPDRKAELDEFIEAYPGVTKIPDEVFKLHTQGGVRLKAAYMIYEQQQAAKKAAEERTAALNELAVLKQNQAAAARAPVTGTVGKAAPDRPEADDPFLRGFMNDGY